MGLYLNSESGNLYCRPTFRNESGNSNSVYLLNSRATPSFPSVEPLPFLSLSADRPINEYVWHQLFHLYASPFHPPIVSSGPFQAKNTGLGDLLPLFPTGEGQVGSWEEYESCKRCHPDLEEVMGKLLVQPTEGKLLADLYSIEGSSLNQIVQLLRPIS